MISQITIQNFQSLRNVTLDLSRFTVIAGESDTGKSAVVRAIKALVTNKGGKDFITHGEASASVSMALDGHNITWAKGVSSSYISDVGSFVKTGTTVPDEILEILGIKDIEIGDVKVNLNIHSQFDSPFLVSATPSLRAKMLGEVSGINILFLATQEARRREVADKRLLGVRQTDLEAVTGELSNYENLPEWLRQLQEVDKTLEKIRVLEETSKQLRLDVDGLEQSKKKLSVLQNKKVVLESGQQVTQKAIGLFDDYQDLENQMSVYGKFLDKMFELAEEHGNIIKEKMEIEGELNAIGKCESCGQYLLS